MKPVKFNVRRLTSNIRLPAAILDSNDFMHRLLESPLPTGKGESLLDLLQKQPAELPPEPEYPEVHPNPLREAYLVECDRVLAIGYGEKQEPPKRRMPRR